ncbi:hypothetical protein GCM10012275_02500 [Longimycelium tulufanense]|uniref:Uncharacterized protein n=1 Tax=Longimycelium tulufanense TaxID=907463 RepID=A0A8J3C9K2_9PSEU|nr:hypothetical protein [Longimycelium tulufanense]GGM34716.1 hypothetical protein GCM10012275_02500 [Longimycelium tulufanense]
MVHLRVEGRPDEIAHAVTLLRCVLRISSTSPFYPHRRDGGTGLVYLDAAPLPAQEGKDSA